MPTIKESPLNLIKLSSSEYKLISGLVYDKFGINLGEQKRSLIVGRLNKVLKQYGLKSFKEYHDYVLRDSTGEALTTLIDRISTNHTFFYRENDHFEYFSKTVIPGVISNLKRKNRRDIRIWCAGCSSGEESYTIAMLLLEHLGNELKLWDVGVLATDISTLALEKAINGVYYDENVSKLPKGLKNKYLKLRPDGTWAVSDRVKSLVLHRKLNLMGDRYPFKKKFQSIFCRNVMIYFDKPTRKDLVKRFNNYMEDPGYLFIGHSETLGRENSDFTYIQPALYRKS
ncbi:MAG: protein-glutamate O-methyltransferase CheR [candidate division Zixibacteria bacterium]